MAIFNTKVIIFDLDGTLIDSRQDIADAVNYALEENEITKLAEDKIFSYIGNGSTFLIQKSLGREHKAKFDEVFKSFVDYYSKNLVNKTELFDDVHDILEHFKDKKIYLLSNKPTEFCKVILEKLEIRKYFKEVYGSDSFPKLKPDPVGIIDIFRTEKVLQEECLFVGDSPQDINAAKSAGIKMAAVTYGYHSENRLKKDNPDLLIDTLSALKNYLD
jgi:2-phosphoglycolate phosphatase